MLLNLNSALAPGDSALLRIGPCPEKIAGFSMAQGTLHPEDGDATPPAQLKAGHYLNAGGEPGGDLLQVRGVQDWPLPTAQAGHVRSCRALLVTALAHVPASPPQKTATAGLLPREQGLSLAWIALSDSGAAGLRDDASGPRIAELVAARYELSLVRGQVIPDDPAELKARLADLALVQGFDLILTTGGTGLTPRDTTPEATLAVLERRLEGLERAMTLAGLAKTPHAALSRAAAGTLGRSIIINLPGSPKAVAENLDAILPALGHASSKLKGDPAPCGG